MTTEHPPTASETTHCSPPVAGDGAASRAHFIDALRILALGWLLVYHVGMYYVSWDWHIKSAQLLPELEPWMRLSSPWRMSLLFIVSGAATAWMLRGRAADGPWLRQRASRLLLPLVFGMLVVVPPQSYLEVVEKAGYPGGWLAFLGLYYRGYDGFCRVGHGCLIMPTWNHLWFLPYLFVYTVLLWMLLRRWPLALERAGARMQQGLAGWRLLALPWLWVWAVRMGLGGYGQTHALVDDPYSHAQYLPAFAFGALAATQPGLWARMSDARWLALAAALGGWALRLAADDAPMPVRAALVSLQQVGALIAALGFAYRHLATERVWLRRWQEAVFPVYILHQTVIMVLATALARWAMPPGVEAVVLLVGTLVVSVAGWALASRITWLRPWMGMAPVPARRSAGSGVACAS
ncbi:MAG: acyltransferase family protein [Burkholderiaceae bacterium]|jgi:hypothetical protein|nr:acyltransferase family protein [Burkholderiaceae bacterium]